MNVRTLKKLLEMLPEEFLDRPVYYATEFKDEQTKRDFDPESLTDITEFVVDTDANCIVLRDQLGW